MGLLELPDLRHTLVDIGTTLLCIRLPGRTLPINLIHEKARRSERVDNAALSSAVITTQKNTKNMQTKQTSGRHDWRRVTINDILALPIAVKSSRYKGNK